MQARERMIRERFAQQACTHCGAPYPPTGVLILARRRPTWMVMATCRECDRRAVFVVNFPADRTDHPSIPSDRPHLLPRALPLTPTQPLPPFPSALPSSPPDPSSPLRPPAQPPVGCVPPAAGAPLTEADVEAIRAFLDRFDGDFRALFAHWRLADGSSS